MKTKTKALEQVPSQITLLKTFLLALPMMILTFMIVSGGKPPSEPSRLLALVITFIFFNLLFVLMIRTGKTDRYQERRNGTAYSFSILPFFFLQPRQEGTWWMPL